MEEGTKKLNDSITFIPEKDTSPWWRKKFDRQKDGLLIPEVVQDMQKILRNLTKPDEKGILRGKYNCIITNLIPNPKSSQGNLKTKYQKYLIKELKSKEKNLKKFYNKQVLVYLIIYLRKERFETHDVDNFTKAILDALKVYIGDDRNVISLIVDKKPLEGYAPIDLDFVEQVVLVVTDPEAKKDILL